MKVDKIARLFQALSQTPTTQKVTASAEESKAQAAAKGSSAVALAPGLGANSDDSERSAKVARIKEQVANGTYKPDSQAVAQSVARELFA